MWPRAGSGQPLGLIPRSSCGSDACYRMPRLALLRLSCRSSSSADQPVRLARLARRGPTLFRSRLRTHGTRREWTCQSVPPNPRGYSTHHSDDGRKGTRTHADHSSRRFPANGLCPRCATARAQMSQHRCRAQAAIHACAPKTHRRDCESQRSAVELAAVALVHPWVDANSSSRFRVSGARGTWLLAIRSHQ
jgi:hypothetical protein